MSAAPPRIGVTRWEDVPGEKLESYLAGVDAAGGRAVVLNAGDSLDRLDGLVLTGGLDVTPARYGEAPHPKVKLTDAARDDFEEAALNYALERDLPVLAICRGHQLLNVALGGRLRQHIDSGEHRADFSAEGQPSRWHSVRLLPGSRLRDVYGDDDIEVNSRHHQAVLPEMVAPGLTITALSPDGLVEGVESASHRWVVGVQWHPERPEAHQPDFAPRSRRLFAAFVAEAQRVVERA